LSSRIALDNQGRTVAVISVTTLPGLELGHRFVVLGDYIDRTAGRVPIPRERMQAQRHGVRSHAY
jgi:hypothetical protein